MKKDYWAILGLREDASDKEIRSAYKRLARKYHPDVNQGDKRAEEKFKEISEAYEVLSDPKKRNQWKQGEVDFESFFRQRAQTGGAGDVFGSFGFGAGVQEILEELFGGARAGRRGGGMGGARGGFQASPGADLQYEASIGFEEAVQGTLLRIPLARTATCDTCGGTGQAPGRPARCSTCRGAGTRRANETLNVKIPPGVDDGAKVRVAGKGEAGARGGPPGDLYVLLHIQPHRYFRRQGSDILLDLPLTMAEATLGTRIDVPTIGGRVTLKVPAGSSSGQRLRLRGRGIPSRNGSKGDQIVQLQIVTPSSVDARSKEMLEEFERLNPIDPRSDLGW